MYLGFQSSMSVILTELTTTGPNYTAILLMVMHYLHQISIDKISSEPQDIICETNKLTQTWLIYRHTHTHTHTMRTHLYNRGQ